ncbi:MAG: Mu transposase C-terminal domain-containing protein [Victivallaceae bacterium]
MSVWALLDEVKEPAAAVLPAVAGTGSVSCLTVRDANDIVPEYNLPARRVGVAPSLTEATDEEKAICEERWLFCKLVMDRKDDAKEGEESCCKAVAAMNATRFPTLLSKGVKLGFGNFRNWKKCLTNPVNGKIDWNNKQALLDKYAKGKIPEYGDPRFWRLFYALFLNRNRLHTALAYREAATAMRKADALAIIPDEHQVRYRVDQLEPRQVNMARYGREYVEQNMLDYIDRDWSEVAPNQVWFADHRVFDFPIKIWNEKEQCWEPRKPWICAFVDAKSWYMIAANVDLDEQNNEDIRNTFAGGVAEYGLPDAIYCDNGKDFRKHGFTTPVKFDEYEHSIMKSLNVRVIHSLPYNGKAKLVERFFEYISMQYDKMFAPYLGNTISARPEAAKFYYEKKEYAHLLMTLQEMTDEFYRFIDRYHDTPHEGKMLDGMTPRQAFAPEKRFVRAQKTRDELAYAFLLPEKSLRVVSCGPAITFDNRRYKGDCLYPYMKKADSKTAPQLMIKTDMMDKEHIYAYEPNGKLVGECRTEAFVKAIATTDEERALLSERLARKSRQLKNCETLIMNITGGWHLLAPHDVLQLPMETLTGNATLEKVGRISQVKGDHTFSHIQIKGQSRAQLQQPPPENIPAPVKRSKNMELHDKLAKMLLKGKTEPAAPKMTLVDHVKPPEAKEKFILKD